MNDGTLKVAQIEDHRPATTATHTISYVLDGFQITSVIETAATPRQIVDRLKAIGAQPPVGKADQVNAGNMQDAPVCQYHGKMKQSKFGGWHCTAKMGDGSYCDQKTK
jgi:hypothetical protein